MVAREREPLKDEVEVDEFLVGGVEEGTHGARQRGQKSLCAGAIEVRGRGSGRLRLRVVPDASARSLGGFVAASVERGAIVRADAWPGYAGLRGLGFSTVRGASAPYARRAMMRTSCRGCTEPSPTSRVGCAGPPRAFPANTSRSTSTSSSSALTDGSPMGHSDPARAGHRAFADHLRAGHAAESGSGRANRICTRRQIDGAQARAGSSCPRRRSASCWAWRFSSCSGRGAPRGPTRRRSPVPSRSRPPLMRRESNEARGGTARQLTSRLRPRPLRCRPRRPRPKRSP